MRLGICFTLMHVGVVLRLLPQGVALRWAFTELGAQVVLWRAVGGNEVSLRVAQKLGFECTSLLPGWFYTQGEYVDEVGGTLTRARFEAQWGL